jgi:hypothetical protein
MIRLFTLLVCFCIFNVAQAQEDTLKKVSRRDTTRITLGKKEIRIVETDEGTDIKVRKKDESESKDKSQDITEQDNKNFDWGWKSKRSNRFRGHWDGISFGYNGFLNKDHGTSLSTPENSFMSLNNNPSKSININAHFCQVSQPLIGRRFGLVTGLGIEFNNYFFENNNTIVKDSAGVIVPVYYDPIQLDKSKLALVYFTIPLMLEWQLPANSNGNKRLWISAGVTGSIKLNSHTKVVYRKNGDKQKDKNRDDFNISALRYGFTGKVGYSHFYVYGNYYPVQLFEKNMGPELYPFSVGIGFHID